MIYLQALSALLFLISFESIQRQGGEYPDSAMEMSAGGKLKLTGIQLISFIFLTIAIFNIGEIKWYWSLLILILSLGIIRKIATDFYSSLLGYKSKPIMSLMAGEKVKYNMYIIDSLITFFVGTVLFIVTKLL